MPDPNKHFQPRFFLDTDVTSILSKDELKIFVLERDKKDSAIYDTFNEDFSNYLTKMPDSAIKKSCQNLLNKNLIFLGIAKTKPDNVVVRIFITSDNKFAGVALDSQQLGIDPTTGSAESIDECIYATYFGLIRAAIEINKTDVRQNKDLHKLMSTYLYLLFLKVIGSDKLYSEKQRSFVHMLSIYIYYKHYLREKHSYILSIIQRDYEKIVGEENLKEFLPTLEEMKDFTSIKDFPKMLLSAKIINESPNIMIMSLLKLLKPMGFYSLTGSLDYFIALVIITKYPAEFIGSQAPTHDKIQNAVEEIVTKYIDKVRYDLTAVEKY